MLSQLSYAPKSSLLIGDLLIIAQPFEFVNTFFEIFSRFFSNYFCSVFKRTFALFSALYAPSFL
jgi:hypothetical protein